MKLILAIYHAHDNDDDYMVFPNSHEGFLCAVDFIKSSLSQIPGFDINKSNPKYSDLSEYQTVSIIDSQDYYGDIKLVESMGICLVDTGEKKHYE